MVQLDPAVGGRVEALASAYWKPARVGCATALRQYEHDTDFRVVDRRVVAQRHVDLGWRVARLDGARWNAAQFDGNPIIRWHRLELFGDRHRRGRRVDLAAASLGGRGSTWRGLAGSGRGWPRRARRACAERDGCRDCHRCNQRELLKPLATWSFR